VHTTVRPIRQKLYLAPCANFRSQLSLLSDLILLDNNSTLRADLRGKQYELWWGALLKAYNCLGHFVLVHSLLPHMAPSAAMVSIGSSTHLPGTKLASQLGFRGAIFPNAEAVARGQLDPGASTVQQGVDRYATSKLCNTLFTSETARRAPLSKAHFLALDQGLMPGTGLARSRSSFTRFTWFYFQPTLRIFLGSFMSTPARSATALAALLTGMHYGDRTSVHVDFTLAETPTSPDAKRRDLARDLYDVSARLGAVDRLPAGVVAPVAT
jgi:NAD(P)-dependent dehydrogenase (short-subunit alcohol dehydrogenase family)